MKRLSAALIAGALLALGAAAHALDNKAYSGGTCHPANANISYSILGAQGFIQNTSGAAASFHCPIVRDEVQGNTAVRVSVFVNDSSAAAGITCTSFSVDPTGAVVGFANASTTAAFVGAATLTMIVNPTGVAVGNNYHVTCSLPSGSQIRAYFVTENEQID